MLIICVVFATTATAFMHLNEHQDTQTHTEHYHTSSDHQDHDFDHESEHTHHFNLHVIGDLIEHDSMLFTKRVSLFSREFSTHLISRSYTPPIPPPTA